MEYNVSWLFYLDNNQKKKEISFFPLSNLLTLGQGQNSFHSPMVLELLLQLKSDESLPPGRLEEPQGLSS